MNRLLLQRRRVIALFLFILLTTACGGGGGSNDSGPSDTTRPGVQIEDTPDSHDGRTAFTLRIRFSESVSGFARGDISVSGGAVTAFSGSGASYTATLTPSTPPGNIAFEVPANVAQDAAGNGNTAATRQTVAYVAPDTTPPEVSINAPDRHNGQPFEVTFVFSEPVRGFEAGDIRISGGRIAPFPSRTSSTRYTATLTPSTPLGNIALEVPANVAQDLAGNGNTAAAPQTVVYVPPDTTPPRVSINAPNRHNGRPFAVSFVFSEAVRGFEAADIRISGGRITAFSSQASSARYTATLTPSTPPGTIALEVPANVARDLAGNGNTAVARQTVVYVAPDTTPPRVTIDAPDSHDGRTAFTLHIRFSESVSGFARGDIRVSGGAVTAFSGRGASYTATVSPAAGRDIDITVPADVAQDAAGNDNRRGTQRVPYVAIARLSGNLTFDRVPHSTSGVGLDYANTRRRPIRGAVVEAVGAADASGQEPVLARTASDAQGRYSLTVTPDTPVRIRVKAHLLQTRAGAPRWDVQVKDNTSGNALYVLQGSLASAASGNSSRDLHAASGWGGSGYTGARAAAPFAILSTVYAALEKLGGVDADINIPALTYYWSVDNRSSDAPTNLATGIFGNPFYSTENRAIYLFGRENARTNEYDPHTVLHEFAHHLQAYLFRNDTLGGIWTSDLRLDMRIAFSEGSANALAAMILDDPVLRSSYGPRQAQGAANNIETKRTDSPSSRNGWYSAASVAAVLYDLYDASDDGADRISLGLAPVYATLSSRGFRENPRFTSIYTFMHQLRGQVADLTAIEADLRALLNDQGIFGRGDKGAGETNSGGIDSVLPVYHDISVANSPVTLCSFALAFPAISFHSSLGIRAFAELRFAESGSHTLSMRQTSGPANAAPEFVLYSVQDLLNRAVQRGVFLGRDGTGNKSLTRNFQAGTLTMEAFDLRNADNRFGNEGLSCFAFSVVRNE